MNPASRFVSHTSETLPRQLWASAYRLRATAHTDAPQCEDACRREFSTYLVKHAEFKPWPCQQTLATALQGERLISILKARQLGVSTGLAAYAWWVARFQPSSLVLLMSKGEREAVEFLRKVKEAMRMDEAHTLPPLASSQTQLLFPNNSRIIALPSTEDAGIGYTATVVVCDEHAFHPYAEANFAAVKPTIDAGGQLVSVSTANGMGNFYHTTYLDAKTGKNGFSPIFFPWWQRPDRDDDWYGSMTREYSTHQLHQNYPRDDVEAFVQSGRPVFSSDYLLPTERPELDPIHWPKALRGMDGLRIWQAPRRHRSERYYLLGADPAEGLAHGDYSALEVIDSQSGEQVLEMAGHWEPDQFAERIHAVTKCYQGKLGVERQNHGHAVLLRLRQLGTKGLYYEIPRETQKKRMRAGLVGWLTSSASKPIMIDELEEAIRRSFLTIHSDILQHEALSYQHYPNGSTGAPQGMTDDRVIALAIAWQMRKHTRQKDKQVQEPEFMTTAHFKKMSATKTKRRFLIGHGH